MATPTTAPVTTHAEDLELEAVHADLNGSRPTRRVLEPDELSHASNSLPIAAQGNLDWVDVAALVINKMIGTGILLGPLIVLDYTRNKSVALTFWILGFVYTLFSATLYLEYSRELMYNGGELIYLDHALTRWKPGPWLIPGLRKHIKSSFRLLAYTMYAFYMILMYNTTTNAMRFGEEVLIASNVTASPIYRDAGLSDASVPPSWLRFIAVVVTTALCLLNLWSASASLRVNKAFAAFKLVLLLIFICAGGYHIKNHPAAGSSKDWSDTHYKALGDNKYEDPKWARALLYVLFAYFGWDNATQVAGDIPRYADLRSGFYVGVVLVGVLYTIVAIIINYAFAWTAGGLPGIGFLALFFSDGQSSNDAAQNERAVQAAAVLIAISALGNINSIIYTCTRVNQSIAWAGILPGSRFWRRSAARHSNRASENPEGGTLIHWIITVFYITVTAAYKSLNDAVGFGGNLQVYGFAFAQVAVGIAFAFIYKPSADRQRTTIEREAPPAPAWLRPGFAPWLGPVLLAFVPAAFGSFIIVASPKEPENQVYTWITLGVLGSGVLYWLTFNMNLLSRYGIDLEIREHSSDVHDASHGHAADNEEDRRSNRNCRLCDQAGAHRHYVYGYHHYLARRRKLAA